MFILIFVGIIVSIEKCFQFFIPNDYIDYGKNKLKLYCTNKNALYKIFNPSNIRYKFLLKNLECR